MAGILIAAIAGRMLASSARRGGYDVAVLDLFNDLDTRRIAPVSAKIRGYEQGLARFSRPHLLQAAAQLAPGDAYPGLVFGSGFEDDCDTLAALAAGRTLYGNSIATIRAIKDPLQFFSLLKKWAIPHPPFSLTLPGDMRGWLSKKIGGSGGAHVNDASQIDGQGAQHYFQRYIEGKNYSVSFLADGQRAQIVGFNEPWTVALGDWSYCYLGAINYVSLPRALVGALQRSLDCIVRDSELLGLNGMDFIVRGDDFFVIEVNPRPSGTLDLYDADCPQGLLHWHVQASNGNLPKTLFVQNVIRAHAVVYTEQALRIAGDVQWPVWCSDIPEPGSVFAARMPVCMVHADGDNHAQVRALVHDRRLSIVNRIQQLAA